MQLGEQGIGANGKAVMKDKRTEEDNGGGGGGGGGSNSLSQCT